MTHATDWNIVLIDDEEDIRDVMTVTLEDAGYRVMAAENGETGRQIQVNAEPAAEEGLFTAEVNLPQAGTWEWSVRVEPFNQPFTFASLSVLSAEQAPVAEQVEQTATSVKPAAVQQAGFDWQLLVRWAGLALLFVAGCLFALDRLRARKRVVTAPDGQGAS